MPTLSLGMPMIHGLAGPSLSLIRSHRACPKSDWPRMSLRFEPASRRKGRTVVKNREGDLGSRKVTSVAVGVRGHLIAVEAHVGRRFRRWQGRSGSGRGSDTSGPSPSQHRVGHAGPFILGVRMPIT